MAISANLKFYLNNKLVPAPIEWSDIEILSSFDNDSIQANITADSFTFVNEARTEILNYINDGLSGGLGIFEGMPFSIEANNSDNSISVFNGFIDLSNELIDFPEAGRLEASIIKADGLNNLNDKISALNYGYLLEEGFITDSDYIDIPYVVAQPTNLIDLAVLGITIYLMGKELNEQIQEIAKDAAAFFGMLAILPTGGVGAAVQAAIALTANIAYAGALLSALIQLSIQVINTLLPIKRNHKGIKLKKLISAVAQSVGYELETDIALLDNLVFLASNNNVDQATTQGFIGIQGSISQGIPNSSDYGYTVSELFQLAKRTFNAKFAIDENNKLQFRSENSSYWTKTASYTLPDILTDSVQYNTEELNANLVLSFDTDIRDDWTIDNFTGTNFEIITDAINVSNEKAKSLKGLEKTNFNICLGNRKDSLNALETTLLVFASSVDAITSVFATLTGGQKTNFAAQIKASTGILKVSNNNHSKPKLLYVDESNLIPSNHRSLFSARVLWDNYHNYKSFVSDNYNGQKKRFTGVRIPFGLNDYIKLVNNSYISTEQGSEAKIEKISWRIGSDYAIIDYWIREPYTKNLKETFIEP